MIDLGPVDSIKHDKWSNVEVKLFARKNGECYVRIELESNVSPGGISFKEIDFDPTLTLETFANVVRLAGGMLADYQNKYYRDRHQPHQVATTAKELFLEVFEEVQNKDKNKAPKFIVERPFGYEDGDENAEPKPVST